MRGGETPAGANARSMADHILIQGLRVDCLIGLAEWERLVAQTVVVDLKLWCDVRGPAAADQLGPEDLNTKALSKRLQAYIGESQFQLLETLTERVASLILEEFKVERVRVRVTKPGALRGARSVAVQVERP